MYISAGKIVLDGQIYLISFPGEDVVYQTVYQVAAPSTHLMFIRNEYRYQMGRLEWDVLHGLQFVQQEDVAITESGFRFLNDQLMAANELSFDDLKPIIPIVISNVDPSMDTF